MNADLAFWTDAAVAQLWQVTLLAVVVALVVRLAARSRPHLAYLLWMLVIVKCLTPPIVASPTGVFSWARWQTPETIEETSRPLPITDERPPSAVLEFPSPPPVPLPPDLPAVDDVADTATETLPAVAVSAESTPDVSRHAPAFALLAVWIVGAALLMSFMGCKWIGLRRQLANGRAAHPAWLSERVAILSRQLGLRKAPRVFVSSQALGPLSTGVWRPTIVLPAALLDASHGDATTTTESKSEAGNRDALDAVLAHELLHLHRRDVAVGYLQLVTQMLWWFHPLVWWANREARRERERCCDEAVLARLACPPKLYARALVDVLELKHRHALDALLPIATAGDVHDRRLRHILSPAARFHGHTPRWCWLIVLLAAAVCLPGAGLSRDAASAADEGQGDVQAEQQDDERQEPETFPLIFMPIVEPPGEGASDTGAETTSPRQEPKFGRNHERAVQRLRELGAGYRAEWNTRTDPPSPWVILAITRTWQGNTEDWRLLADLEHVDVLNLDVPDDQQDGLDVLAQLDGLYGITLTRPTPTTLAKVGKASSLQLLHLYSLAEESAELVADDIAPLAALSNLTMLHIADVPFDDAALVHVGKLGNLKHLHLYGLNISDAGLAALETLANLEGLQIASSLGRREGEPCKLQVTGAGLAQLDGLRRLGRLILYGPTITDEGLAGVAALPALKHLHLNNVTNVTAEGIRHISTIAELQSLEVWQAQLAGDEFSPLADLKKLRSLSLAGDTKLDDIGAEHVAKISTLRALYFGGEQLTPRGLRALTGLKELRILHMDQTPMTVAALREFAQLPELQRFTFDGSRLDDSAIPALRSLPNLRNVSLGGARVTDKGLAQLADGARYESIALFRTQITNDGLAALSGISDLRVLDLEDTAVSNDGLLHLTTLENLEELYLNGTRISDEGLLKLAALKSLKTLVVARTDVTAEGVEKLRDQLPGLETLIHPGNRFWDIGRNVLIDLDRVEIYPDEENAAEEGDHSATSTPPAETAVVISGSVEVDGTFTPIDSEAAGDESPPAPEFSERHERAAARLHELGASMNVGSIAPDQRPQVSVRIGDEWRGTLDDWELLGELDYVSVLQCTNLTRDTLAKIGQLESLPWLIIENTQRRPSSLRSDDYAPLARLQELTRFSIMRFPFDDDALGHLANCAKLEDIWLYDTQVTDAGIARLAPLVNLRSIQVSNSPGEDTVPFAGVTGSGFSALAELPQLELVALQGAAVTDDGLAGVAHARSLRRLALSFTPNVTGRGVLAISQLPQLQELTLHGPDLAGDDFAPLVDVPDLRVLHTWRDTSLDDAAAAHVSQIKSLRRLEASTRNTTEQGLVAVCGLPNLRKLSLSGVELTPRALERLTGAKELRSLTMSARPLNDSAVDRLRSFPRLFELSLSHAQITDEGLARLVRGKDFSTLRLAYAPITDAGVAALEGLEHLQTLSLHGSAITDAALEQLTQFESLNSLWVQETDVTEEGVNRLAIARPDLTVFHDYGGPSTYGTFEFEQQDMYGIYADGDSPLDMQIR